MLKREIDHIVYCVPDLDVAIADLTSLWGVQPTIGGRHLTKGTKNALINLGNGCYFELLAIDEENTEITADRWMGVDLIQQPKITRWALKTSDLNTDCLALATYDEALSEVFEGSRKTSDGSELKWKMTLPKSHPEVELVPFMTDWTTSDYHPTDRMTAQCQLTGLQLFHPHPEQFKTVFQALNVDVELNHSNDIKIQLKIEAPTGTQFVS